MFNFGSKIILLFLLAFPVGLIVGQVSAEAVSAEEDIVEGEEEEGEEEEVLVDEDQPGSETEDDEDDDSSLAITAHPYADTTIIFVTGATFPADEIVKFLVGFTNKGSQEFSISSLEASFRYPQDYLFFVQNFTALPLATTVMPQTQVSFEYSFIPALQMAGRPFILVILLNYQDNEGNAFQTYIYNQTVTISEIEEGFLEAETVFMYIFLGGLIILASIAMYQVLESRTRRTLRTLKVETGTGGGMSDVDISWIPQETLNIMNKTSPRASPRKRTKRAAGTDQ